MKTIFFDIDGTLVTDDEKMEISESTRTAIAELRKNGHLTFINTGRPVFIISDAIRELGFDGYVCGCGTYVEYGGEVVFSNELDKGLCQKTAEICRECRVAPVYEYRNRYYFDSLTENTKGIEFFKNIFTEGVRNSGRVGDDDFIFDKFVAFSDENSDMELFHREIGKNFEIIDRGSGFYEMVPHGCTKGTGIDMILKRLGTRYEDAYAVGDSMNDLPMLLAVPNSIAMGGAENIYPYVSYVTTSVSEDGIYNAMKHFNLV